MMKSSLLMIAVLGCVSAKVIQVPSDPAPENPESLVPRTWMLTIRKATDKSPADLNKDFEPPQPWTMNPVGKLSDVNLTNSIRIRVPNNFLANARREIYACGHTSSSLFFFLDSIEGPTSVFTYPSQNNEISDDPTLWEVDTSERLERIEDRGPDKYQFSIRPANSIVQQN